MKTAAQVKDEYLCKQEERVSEYLNDFTDNFVGLSQTYTEEELVELWGQYDFEDCNLVLEALTSDKLGFSVRCYKTKEKVGIFGKDFRIVYHYEISAK